MFTTGGRYVGEFRTPRRHDRPANIETRRRIVLLAIVVALVFWLSLILGTRALIVRDAPPDQRTKSLRTFALSVTAAAGLVGIAWLIDSVKANPVVLVLLLSAIAVLVPLAWSRSYRALPLIVLALLIVVAIQVAGVLNGARWAELEQANGPVRLATLIALAAVLGVLGFHKPFRGGGLLVGISLLPLVSLLKAGTGRAPVAATTTLLSLVVGLAYLAAAGAEREIRKRSTARRS